MDRKRCGSAARTLASTTLLFGLLLVSAPSLSAQTCEQVDGVWSVDLSMGGGTSNVTLTLAQDQCALTGTVVGRTTTDIQDGVVEGAAVSFVAVGENGATGDPVAVRWTGTVEGDEISGVLNVPGGFQIPFSGARTGG